MDINTISIIMLIAAAVIIGSSSTFVITKTVQDRSMHSDIRYIVRIAKLYFRRYTIHFHAN